MLSGKGALVNSEKKLLQSDRNSLGALVPEALDNDRELFGCTGYDTCPL